MHNDSFHSPDYVNHSRRGAKPGLVLLSIPLGAVAGFILGIALEMLVGILAGATFSAANPGDAGVFMWLASMPGWGAIAGALIAPVLYILTASRRRRK